MAYKQDPGRGPMMKTGAGVPSALLQTDEKTGEKKHHPGYDLTPYAKPFKPAAGNDLNTQVANVLNKRQYPADSIKAKKMDLDTKFPAIGKAMQSQGMLSNYIARGISAETGDYTVSRKGDFPSNTSTVSRRDVAESSRQSMYVPKITKNKKQ